MQNSGTLVPSSSPCNVYAGRFYKPRLVLGIARERHKRTMRPAAAPHSEISEVPTTRKRVSDQLSHPLVPDTSSAPV